MNSPATSTTGHHNRIAIDRPAPVGGRAPHRSTLAGFLAGPRRARRAVSSPVDRP